MKKLILALACAVPFLPACESTAKGAASGAMYGAAGSALVAAVFGGDVGDAAARGAVGGAAVGGLHGAVSDGQRKQAEAERQQQQDLQQENAELELRNKQLELERELIEKIGADNTRSLASLMKCEHQEALIQAQAAATAGEAHFRLASRWLEALIALDQRDMEAANAVYAKLTEEDPKHETLASVQAEALRLMDKVEETRVEFGLPRRCN